LTDMLRDVRLALRYLLKAPGYTLAVVVTLALAIGANSAIFSTVYAVLLKPLPVRQPGNLVICWERDRAHGLEVVELSYRNFRDWATHSQSFSQTAAIGSSTWPAVLDGHGESARLSSAGVSVSFFETLGVLPELGRGFRPEDDAPKAPRVVILSHGTWVRRFGADAQVVGTTIQLDEPYTIVGVMPEGFDFPRGTDFWTPVVPILANSAKEWRADTLENVGVLFVIGRLREGVTARMARDELDRLVGQLERDGGAHRFGAAVVVTPFLDYVLGPVRQALWALFAAVGLLLLIGCANVSGLMLTRVSLRRREHAVRLALGATGRRLGRLWALETLILSLLGGALGLIASQWIAKAIVALAPEDVPRLSDVSINLPVAAFTFVAVLVTALLCGAEPVRRAGAVNLLEALNDGARSTPGKQSYRARSLLVIVQIGLAVVLLVAAGLVVRSFVNLRKIDLGFVPSKVLTMNVGPRNPKPSANEWVYELLRRVEVLSEVEAAGAVYLRPLALGPIGQEVRVLLEGQAETPEAELRNPALNYQVATPGYFTAMRIQLRRGRLFNTEDNGRSPRVVLVGETTARHLWPGLDPIGKHVRMPTLASEGAMSAWRTVVGVVSDVRYRGIDDVRLDVYAAALQSPMAATDLVVRTSGDPLRVAGMVQAEARRLDPRVVVDRLTTMEAIVSRALGPWRFGVWMFTLFAVLAFMLAMVGLVTLVSLDLSQRRHEFAVRLALGAQRPDILRSVLLVAGGRVLAGVALGVLTAIAGTRGIRSMLFGIGALDVSTYGVVIAVVFAAVVVASYLPARRAAAIDPLALLRRE
jgi:putative ABC transport system permease protein